MARRYDSGWIIGLVRAICGTDSPSSLLPPLPEVALSEHTSITASEITDMPVFSMISKNYKGYCRVLTGLPNRVMMFLFGKAMLMVNTRLVHSTTAIIGHGMWTLVTELQPYFLFLLWCSLSLGACFGMVSQRWKKINLVSQTGTSLLIARDVIIKHSKIWITYSFYVHPALIHGRSLDIHSDLTPALQRVGGCILVLHKTLLVLLLLLLRFSPLERSG